MNDGESPDQAPPLKPILPPLTGITTGEIPEPGRDHFKAAGLPSVLRERKQKLDRNLVKRVLLATLVSLTEFGLLTTSAFLIVYLVLMQTSFAGASRKSSWIVSTALIVVVSYILLRICESRLRRRFFRLADESWESLNQDTVKRRRYLLDNQQKRVAFKDIALPNETAEALKRLVDFMKEPHKYQRLGAEFQRGFLLVGPSGNGKTFAAHAVAGEIHLPFFQLSEPVSSLADFHEFLDNGVKNAPAVLFLDNLDSITRSRSIWPDPQTMSLEATTTALISFFDDHVPRDGVIVLAATNRPDLIDEALIRPGRLNVLEIPYPDLRRVEGILKIHTRKVPLAEDVDLSIIARRFLEVHPDCTGAMIAEACNLAATVSAERSAKLVNQESLLDAVERTCKREDSNRSV